MKINPLIGMMTIPQLRLAPEGAGGAGGNGSSDNSDTDNQDDDVIDLGIDEDLLPEAERVALQKAKEKLQALQGKLKASKTTEELLQRVQSELNTLKQSAQRQQQQNQPAERTFEDEMLETYMAKGMSKEEAMKAVEINAPILGKLAERLVGHMGQTLAPVANQVVTTELNNTFTQLQATDGRMSVPEIAQEVWTKAENIVKNGGQVPEAVMKNLLKIAYVDFMDANPDYEFEDGQPTRIQPTPPVTRQPVTKGTRFTFPNSGHVVRAPRVSTPSSADPAIEAAMAQVKKHWKGWEPKGLPTAPKVK